jgi:hypothetical protein
MKRSKQEKQTKIILKEKKKRNSSPRQRLISGCWRFALVGWTRIPRPLWLWLVPVGRPLYHSR